MTHAGESDAVASDLTAAIAVGQADPVAAVETALRRAASASHLGAFLRLDADNALSGARTARVGPLRGVPIAVKDNIHVAGEPTSAGSAGLLADRSDTDATVVARLRAAGAVPFGKTTLNEFAMGWSGQNRTFGPTRNPLDATRTAGGSSGGSAAAVASGIVPVALGTDTNGSIRVPAAFCGVVGFRPSTGRYPTQGLIPLAPSLDTVGLLARRVRDLQLVDAVLLGRRPTASTGGSPILVVDPAFFDGAAPEIAEALDDVLHGLREGGARVIDLRTRLLERIDGVAPAIIGSESWRAIAGYGRARRLDPDHLRAAAAPEIATSLRRSNVGDTTTLHAMAATARETLVGVLDRVGADAVLLPTVLIEAPRLDDRFDTPAPDAIIDGRTVPAREVYGRNVALASVTGAPALTLPVATAAGLAAGVELVGRPRHDRRLLRSAAAVEAQLCRAGLATPGW